VLRTTRIVYTEESPWRSSRQTCSTGLQIDGVWLDVKAKSGLVNSCLIWLTASMKSTGRRANETILAGHAQRDHQACADYLAAENPPKLNTVL